MKRIGVLTSGGDAQGMNAAVRAVVRTAINQKVEVFAICEGYQGMVDGGKRIRPLQWQDVGGILHQGGTIIGSARCQAFRTYEGRKQAARNLLKNGIEGLVIIGGDGSLTGANILRLEWNQLLTDLISDGEIPAELAQRHQFMPAVGLIGSIDNDMYGTDMTIGTDTALHRIVEAIDAISSTAASHQRTFVVEVMGRRCGYLALMSTLATGADWVLIPENPPNLDAWEDKMCAVLRKGREIGRRDSIVIIAEGAQDRYGKPISSSYVKKVLEEKLGEDTRVTILGHVQRGGSPTAFDRNLSTILGYSAVHHLLKMSPDQETMVIGMRGNRIVITPLSECIAKTKEIAEAITRRDYNTALNARGSGFARSFRTVRTLVRALPHDPDPNKPRHRLAILHGSAPAPGMNTAVRAAVRLAVDKGHILLGVQNGFRGLIQGDIRPLDWMSVNGWAARGGAELGTNRKIPEGSDLYAIAKNIEVNQIEGILMIGGSSGYEAILELHKNRHTFPAFNIPMVCLPASIDNDLPASELSVGADTALNSIIDAVDKIKQSAVAARRAFIVEVMGRYCGYLALMSAMATGAERVYLPEEGVTLPDMMLDVQQLLTGFKQGKRVGLIIRNEAANPVYSTEFMQRLFGEEAGGAFDVRTAILGHIQQGGNPSPFDRIQATRLATECITFLEEQLEQTEPMSACIGLLNGTYRFTNLEDIPRLMDKQFGRPKQQWWLNLRLIAKVMAKPGPVG